MEKIKINNRFVTIKFTHEEVLQLHGCLGQANSDGDHKEWLRSAGATEKELKALDSVMGISQDAVDMVIDKKGLH